MYRGKGQEAYTDRERLEKCSLAELQVGCVTFVSTLNVAPEKCRLTQERPVWERRLTLLGRSCDHKTGRGENGRSGGGGG